MSNADTRPAVHIKEAAALYGLPPSTLRWWEQTGVITPPARGGDNRRRYSRLDLRRIGLAYICCVAGKMPLPQAATVAAGTADLPAWRTAIREQGAHIDEQIRELVAARDYLDHLLTCEHDYIAQCPMLEAVLRQRTPRGRYADADIAVAARRAGGLLAKHGADPDSGDDNAMSRDVISIPRCLRCEERIALSARGRPRRYCSRACQQRAYRDRSRRLSPLVGQFFHHGDGGFTRIENCESQGAI